MEKVFALLSELLIVQRLLVSIGHQLVIALEKEEESAAQGFSLAQLQAAVGYKDQIIHRFLSTESKRKQLASKLSFLIGLDTRNLVPTLSTICECLQVYSRNLAQVLSGDALQQCKSQIDEYVSETRGQIPEFEIFARRIQRNKTIMNKLLNHVNKSLRFFELACKTLDKSYDKGGKMTLGYKKTKQNSILRVKA